MYIDMWNIWKLTSKLKFNCHLIVFYVAIGLQDVDILHIIKKLFLGTLNFSNSLFLVEK